MVVSRIHLLGKSRPLGRKGCLLAGKACNRDRYNGKACNRETDIMERPATSERQDVTSLFEVVGF